MVHCRGGAAGQRKVSGVLYDLGKAYPEVELDAIYDDTADIRQEDRSLLTSAGAQVFGWMEAERRFKEFVRNAKRH